MKDTKIEWAHHTFNPWIGCAHISPGCANCYAEAQMDHRYKRARWGRNTQRVRTSERYWKQPAKWNAEAIVSGQKPRVFCASLADIGDIHAPDQWRLDLLRLIHQTPRLRWLLLTKRPALWNSCMMPIDLAEETTGSIWYGVSTENQTCYDARVHYLINAKREWKPAKLFLSMEPLLGPIQLRAIEHIDWVIVGGESGPNARPMRPEWVDAIRSQCAAAKVPFFFKQWGGMNKHATGRLLDGRTYDEVPA